LEEFPVSEQVTPPSGVPWTGPVTLINAFTVPREESERFLERWKVSARLMSSQPGFVRARMHQSLREDVELRFVNVAEWATGKALAQANANPEWLASVQEMLDDPELQVIARPAVYQVVVDLHAGGGL
jgi:heme-degrading monooxygenase HmoA